MKMKKGLFLPIASVYIPLGQTSLLGQKEGKRIKWNEWLNSTNTDLAGG